MLELFGGDEDALRPYLSYLQSKGLICKGAVDNIQINIACLKPTQKGIEMLMDDSHAFKSDQIITVHFQDEIYRRLEILIKTASITSQEKNAALARLKHLPSWALEQFLQKAFDAALDHLLALLGLR